MSIDPTRLEIESNSPPIWEREEDFSQVMSEQLKHAPWFAVSIFAHLLAGFLLYIALEGQTQLREAVATALQIPEPEQEIEDEVPKEEPIEPEDPIEETFTDVEVTETDDEDNPVEDVADHSVQSAFESNQWNTAPGLLGGAAGTSGRFLRKRGGGGRRSTNRAIDAGLRWLRDHQDDNGKWDCDGFMKHDVGEVCTGAGNPVHDIGATGLALLAFLGDGSTLRSGPFKEQIKKGVRWLREQQGENGLFGTAASHDFIYDHAIATYAICEAFGLSNYKSLRKTAQSAIGYLESHRNPYGCWRYQPQDNDNDVSVTAWAIMAYKSAKDFDLDVNIQALKNAEIFLDEVTVASTGHCGYTKPGEPSSRHRGDHAQRFPPNKGEALTAVGLFCRFFLGQDPAKVPVMKRAAETILDNPPVWDKSGSIDHYYWYYASYALYQMGPPYWATWQKHLTPSVVQTQRKDGNAKGSWDPAGVWGEDGGRVYSTAILVLTLEAYYRYTRLVR